LTLNNIEPFKNDNDVILKVNFRNRAISTVLNGGFMSNVSHIVHHYVLDDFDFKKERKKLVNYLKSKNIISFMRAVKAAQKTHYVQLQVKLMSLSH